jgi:hypothetical protein
MRRLRAEAIMSLVVEKSETPDQPQTAPVVK